MKPTEMLELFWSFFHAVEVHNDECPAEQYGCQHYCVNLPDGGSRCMCYHGYTLASNGRHCEGKEDFSNFLKFELRI